MVVPRIESILIEISSVNPTEFIYTKLGKPGLSPVRARLKFFHGQKKNTKKWVILFYLTKRSKIFSVLFILSNFFFFFGKVNEKVKFFDSSNLNRD